MLLPANRNLSPRLAGDFDCFCCEMGHIVGVGDLRGARLAQAARLDSLPDAALQQMGIARADIPRIVFRDLFG